MMTSSPYVTAEEAAAELGISLATLYSYVSRGLIKSIPVGEGSRRRRYSSADIRKLRTRKERRRNPAAAAAAALDFGDPVLTSSITLIEGGQLFYRGFNAKMLADSTRFEEIATLIWTGTRQVDTWFPSLGHGRTRQLAIYQQIGNSLTTLGALQKFQVLLPLVEASDLAAHDLSVVGVCRSGARLIELMALALTGKPTQIPIAAHLQTSWLPEYEPARRAINAALVLCADHELNASSFTARCVASTGATPYAVVAAGLAALQGPRHGGYTLRCEAFLREALVNPHNAVVEFLRRGEPLPGFGHRLYPSGDPRGSYLIELASKLKPKSPAVHAARTVVEIVSDSLALHPNVDFGLVLLCRALGLPAGAPLGLFALGRTAGWIGHALEQYQSQHLIRPRAAYTGPRPQST